MKKIFFSSLLISSLFTGCNQQDVNTPPQLTDPNSLGCLITNDFYAVHFSAYLKPVQIEKNEDKRALLTPYCQELPSTGKAFFTADLIDRDVRQTPIGIRIVEIEKSINNDNNFKEIRVLNEIEAKLYSKGVVEAQADLDKKGDYMLILLMGGNDALSEEDKLKIKFHVGETPFSLAKFLTFFKK